MANDEKKFCEKCKKNLSIKNFYSTNNIDKYPDGMLNTCKQCTTMHVDNWDPNTYLWILKECDVPYVPNEWNSLMQSYAKDKKKVTGSTILGRYLSKMKLKQWKDYRYGDTDFLSELEESRIKQSLQDRGYSMQDITKVLEEQRIPIPEKPEMPQEEIKEENTNNFFEIENTLETSLSEEDKIRLSVKWGKHYRPEEWIALEQLYNEMMDSYDIQLAGHINDLKLVCKASLKTNQLLDIGDIEGAQKAQKMYESLMKSGKFTAAQNKAEQGEYVDSLSELVYLCEKEGFIPRYYVDEPQDKVDRVLQDLQNYLRTLVVEEMNLGPMIERALEQIQLDAGKNADNFEDEDEESEEEKLFDYSEDTGTIDYSIKDLDEFSDFEDSLIDHDEKVNNGEL